MLMWINVGSGKGRSILSILKFLKLEGFNKLNIKITKNLKLKLL